MLILEIWAFNSEILTCNADKLALHVDEAVYSAEIWMLHLENPSEDTDNSNLQLAILDWYTEMLALQVV